MQRVFRPLRRQHVRIHEPKPSPPLSAKMMTKKRSHQPIPSHRCIFCDQLGLMSQQHVWPKWLQSLFTGHVQRQTNFIRNRIDKLDSATIQIQPNIKRREGKMITLRYRKVCLDCNNGWISSLENDLKPLLTKLITGVATEISQAEAVSLATWIAIITIMAEFSDPYSQAISINDVHHIYSHRTPPQNWNIYVGHYLGSEFAPYGYSHSGWTAVKEEGLIRGRVKTLRSNIQISTHVLGELLMQADSAALEVWTPNALDRIDTSAIFSVWPERSDVIPWPPKSTLGDQYVEKLSAIPYSQF